jgi:hypothetical protein
MNEEIVKRYEAAVLRARVARARCLLQLARDGGALEDLLTMARLFGGCPPAADSLAAFQAAMGEELQAAQAELDRLTGGTL